MRNIKQLLLIATLVCNIVNGQIVDKKITHIVKPGESLHSITRGYLGTDVLWQENWKLNPHVENPHFLSIGQKLTIIKQRIIPSEKALMLEIVNKVEKKPQTGNWVEANLGDELIQKEGIRTFDESSVLLKFNDESQLKILEYSQVFLQSRATNLSGTDSATIVVTKGDAELIWEPIKAGYSEIEIITGTAILKPEIKTGQIAKLRTGLSDSGNSIISVFKGNSNVESGGSKIAIPQGMGVSVKQGQAPPKPKALLKAPKVIEGNINTFNYSNLVIGWNKLNKAAGYLVEICADINCKTVILQQKTTKLNWHIRGLNKKGDFYWRIAGYSDDDIVGYRSRPSLFITTNAVEDTNPPIIALDILGQKQIINEQIIVSPQAKLFIVAVDELSGIESIQYKWDDDNWQQWDNLAFSIPITRKTLFIKATDKLKQASIKQYVINLNR